MGLGNDTLLSIWSSRLRRLKLGMFPARTWYLFTENLFPLHKDFFDVILSITIY